ncbi:MAG: hypothetical protein J7518_10280 [Nocardioidaceae bacterium]|nr:hypothetical protein [Nocardioidaceae bacterium]
MTNRFSEWMGRWGIFAVCCGLLLLVAWSLPTMIDAARNEGTFGTFTAEFEHCHKNDCDWTGTFVSEDRGLTRHDVAYQGPGITGVGDIARVQWLAGDAYAVYEEGDDGWVMAVVVGAGSLAYLVWWGAVRRWRR